MIETSEKFRPYLFVIPMTIGIHLHFLTLSDGPRLATATDGGNAGNAGAVFSAPG
jgi:hypothetical protein